MMVLSIRLAGCTHDAGSSLLELLAIALCIGILSKVTLMGTVHVHVEGKVLS